MRSFISIKSLDENAFTGGDEIVTTIVLFLVELFIAIFIRLKLLLLTETIVAMSNIKALINPVTPFQQNAPIVFCEETKKCAFVDPGGDLEVLLASAANNDLIPEKILLTHGHIDHAAGATELANTLNLEIIGPHIDDKFLLDELEAQGSMLGLSAQKLLTRPIW
jgi:Zn-dependent hydrolases, including glyoxylases